MLAANLTIGTETYNLTGNDLKKSLRSRTGDPNGVDQVLTISHDVAKIAGRTNDRHLVRLDYTTVDSEGIQTDASAYLVINQPRSSAVSNATLISMCETLSTFCTASSGANLAQVLNKEI